MKLRALLLIALSIMPSLVGAQPSPTTSFDAPVLATIFEEDFRANATLPDRGWSIETLAGEPPGYRFLRGETTTAGPNGTYARGTDARLLSPLLDLNHVVATPGAVSPDALPGEASANASEAFPPSAELWPPAYGTPANESAVSNPLPATPKLPIPNATLRPRAQPALARLTLGHAWDFAPNDGAFVEVRVVDTTPSGWQLLLPILPAEGLAHARDILGETPALYNGALADGSPAFTGSRANATSVFDLSAYAGHRIQLAWHVRATYPLDPDTFGWSIRHVTLRAPLGSPNLAIEGVRGVEDGARLALSANLFPYAVVRNWGGLASQPTTLQVTATRSDGVNVVGSPATLEVPTLAPGEARPISTGIRVNSSSPVTYAFDLSLGDERTRLDVARADDHRSLVVHVRDDANLSLELSEDPETVISALAQPKTFTIVARNVGNVQRSGSIELLANEKIVAAAPFVAPLPRSALSSNIQAPTSATMTLRWQPDASERGMFDVVARWSEGSTSNVLASYVDDAPPPAYAASLREAPRRDLLAPIGSAYDLQGWSYDAWTLQDGNVTRITPGSRSPVRSLAFIPQDDLVTGSLGSAAAIAAHGLLPISLTIPSDAELGAPLPASQTIPALEVSRAALALGPLDPAGRITLLNDSPLWESGVRASEGSANATEAHLWLNETSVRSGDVEAQALYVRLGGDLRPGAQVTYGPIILRLGGEETTLLPSGALLAYEDGGIQCCVLGPIRPGEILAALPKTPPALDSTTLLPRSTIERNLADLTNQAPTGAPLLLQIDHEGLAPTLRARVEVGANVIDIMPGGRGWRTTEIPVTAGDTLRLVVEMDDSTLSRCDLLSMNESCPDEVAWRIDDLRLLAKDATGTWRLVAADRLETDASAFRWRGDLALGRGWRFVDAARDAPERWGVSKDGLRWGEPDSDEQATSLPLWTIARTPTIELGALPSPRVTLRARYDFGPEANSSYAAGGAVVALLTDSSGRTRRTLLAPENEAYAGDIQAPAFGALARELGIETPRGASATALVGLAGWTNLTFLLPKSERVALEFHALSSTPLFARGWEIRDLRIGGPGPAHDAAITRLVHAPTAIARGAQLPLTVELLNAGLFQPANATLDLRVLNATGAVAYPTARIRLAGDEIPATGGTLAVTFPTPFVADREEPHVLEVRLNTTPPDENPLDNTITLRLDVRDERSVALRRSSVAALLGRATDLCVEVENTGTLPFNATAPLNVLLDVLDSGGNSKLSAPIKLRPDQILGHAFGPGEAAKLCAAAAWTPTTSGAYQMRATTTIAEETLEVVTPFTVEEAITIPLADAIPSAASWMNATIGDRTTWTFLPPTSANATLTLPPIELRSAAQATLILTQDHELEPGFDRAHVEAQRPDGSWIPLADFTGADARPITLDLADALHERLTLLETPEPSALGASEQWLGPPPRTDAYYAPHADVPSDAPANATAYLRIDHIAFPINVPQDASGDLEVDLGAWVQQGESGDARAADSSVAAYLLAADGTRLAPESPLAGRALWSQDLLTFRQAATLLHGSAPRLIVEAREVSPRVPGTVIFASDLATPYAGVAVTPPTPRANGDVLLVEPPLGGTNGAWITDEARDPVVTYGPLGARGFRPLEPPMVWLSREDGSIEARADAAPYADARLVFPLDLTVATGNTTLALDAEDQSASLADPRARDPRRLTRLDIEASDDGGLTWRIANATGQNTWDLTPFAGAPVLIALHAAFGTQPLARDDSWTIRAIEINADVLRSDEVHLRLRGSADADGPPSRWSIQNAELRVVRHATGVGVRLLSPGEGPLTAGYRTLEIEAVNRGTTAAPPRQLTVRAVEVRADGEIVHETSRSVPALAAGSSVRIPVRGADMNWYLAAGDPPARIELALSPSATDGLRADDVVTTFVGGGNVRERSRVRILDASVDPNVADPRSSPQVTIRARVTNDGEDVASLSPSQIEVWTSDPVAPLPIRILTNARPTTARLLPGETLNVTWVWRPSNTTPVDDYRLHLRVPTNTPRGPLYDEANVTLRLRGDLFPTLARNETFDAGIQGWSCVTAPPCAKESDLSASKPLALALGLPPSGPTDTEARATIESPEFPVVGWSRGWFRAAIRHALPDAQNATLEIAPIDGNGHAGAWARIATLKGTTEGYPEQRFAQLSIELPSPFPADTRGLILRIDVPRPTPGNESLLQIDDVSVTPLAVNLEPPARARLADNVRKDLPFVLHNDGLAADEYDILLADRSGRNATPPEGWKAEVIDPATAKVTSRLRIPAGESHELVLRITVPPTGAQSPLRGEVQLPLLIRSRTLPSALDFRTFTLDAAGSARPDLAIVALKPGADEPAGRTRGIDLAVVNLGLADANAGITLAAQAPDDAGGGLETLRSLEATSAASLRAGATRTVHYTWTPRHAGLYRLVANLDPNGTLVEADRSNNRVVLPVEVPPPPTVDLRVDLSIADENPVTGENVPFRITIRNAGALRAQGIELTARAGSTALMRDAPDMEVGDLAPGASWTLEGSWIPNIPGNVTLVASAYARQGAAEPLAMLDDNARSIPILVREETLRIQHAATNGTLLTYVLTNAGNANETVRLETTEPPGWASSPSTSTLTVLINASANVTVRLLVPDDAPAGSAVVGLDAISIESGRRHVGRGSFVVKARHELDVQILEATLDARSPKLSILVENRGNANETISLRSQTLPSGWALAAQTISARPGTTTRADLPLLTDPTTPAGRVPVELTWITPELGGRAAGSILVNERRDIQIRIDGEVRTGGEGAITVLIENQGNTPLFAPLALVSAGGWSDLDGRIVSLAPGGSEALSGRVALPQGENASLELDGERVPLTLRSLIADVRVDDLHAEATEAGASVRVAIFNAGDVPMEGATLTLYVGDEAIFARALDPIDPGAIVDLDATFAAREGEHAIIARLIPGAGTIDATPDDLTRATSIDIAPQGGIVAAVVGNDVPLPRPALVILILGAFALLRRRRP